MINFVWLEKVHMISPPSLFILHGVLQIWLDLLQYSVQGFSLYPPLGLVFGFSEQTKAFDIIHGSSLRVNRDVIRIANKITGDMYLCKIHFFRQITTFIKVRVAFDFGLQTL